MGQGGPNPKVVLSLEKGEGDSVRHTEKSRHAKTEAQGMKQGKEFRDCCQPPDPRLGALNCGRTSVVLTQLPSLCGSSPRTRTQEGTSSPAWSR